VKSNTGLVQLVGPTKKPTIHAHSSRQEKEVKLTFFAQPTLPVGQNSSIGCTLAKRYRSCSAICSAVGLFFSILYCQRALQIIIYIQQ